MSHPELQQLIEWTLFSVQSGGQLSDDLLQALHIILPDNLIVAALDTIDRGKVVKYSTPWRRSFYQVLGPTTRYTVYLDLPSLTSTHCSCPSFSFNVLLANTQAMCKHVLAVQIARRLGRCVERTITEDDIVAIVCHSPNG